ncbi:MAG: hypothetical protein HUJ51_01455 [Eggerthellaceae bacterium]|nr:hypothetical protein [Eggerthellaceae bacterium]
MNNEVQINMTNQWSIAYLYWAIIDHVEHVLKFCCINTLEGYEFEKLGRNRVISIDEESRILPTDT